MRDRDHCVPFVKMDLHNYLRRPDLFAVKVFATPLGCDRLRSLKVVRSFRFLAESKPYRRLEDLPVPFSSNQAGTSGIDPNSIDGDELIDTRCKA